MPRYLLLIRYPIRAGSHFFAGRRPGKARLPPTSKTNPRFDNTPKDAQPIFFRQQARDGTFNPSISIHPATQFQTIVQRVSDPILASRQSHPFHLSTAACRRVRQLLKMDAVAIRSCIVATLDTDPNNRKRAELQLKQVRNAPLQPTALDTDGSTAPGLPLKCSDSAVPAPSAPSSMRTFADFASRVAYRQRNTTAFSMPSSTFCSPSRMPIFVSPVRVTLAMRDRQARFRCDSRGAVGLPSRGT